MTGKRESDQQCQKQLIEKKDEDPDLMMGSSHVEVIGDLDKSVSKE